MGLVSEAPTGPASSTGFPNTSKSLPSVFSPTGTVIGAPVFSTSKPLFKPSLEPMAMVRTTPSPNCCWTSKTSFPPFRVNASYTFGMLSLGNSTSTTVPIICTIFPVLMSLSSCLIIQRQRRLQFLKSPV